MRFCFSRTQPVANTGMPTACGWQAVSGSTLLPSNSSSRLPSRTRPTKRPIRPSRATAVSHGACISRPGPSRRLRRVLQAKGRLEIENYRGKPHFQLVAKGDAEYRSTSGDKNFYAKRGAFCEAALGLGLTAYERIAYIGIAALTDPTTGKCAEGAAWVAGKIGISKYRMTSAIQKLVEIGILSVTEGGRAGAKRES